MTTTSKVLAIVSRIPQGKVTTYGALAKLAHIKNPRVIGNILHRNNDPQNFPCHRVVDAQGKLAKNFAFGGPAAQENKLCAEGIKIINGKIDLFQYLWDPLRTKIS